MKPTSSFFDSHSLANLFEQSAYKSSLTNFWKISGFKTILTDLYKPNGTHWPRTRVCKFYSQKSPLTDQLVKKLMLLYKQQHLLTNLYENPAFKFQPPLTCSTCPRPLAGSWGRPWWRCCRSTGEWPRLSYCRSGYLHNAVTIRQQNSSYVMSISSPRHFYNFPT